MTSIPGLYTDSVYLVSILLFNTPYYTLMSSKANPMSESSPAGHGQNSRDFTGK